jgi:hypothetical protein
MISELENELEKRGFHPSEVAVKDDVNEIDDVVDQSGQVRCENFCDFANEYAHQFGPGPGDEKFEEARSRAIDKAWAAFRKKWTKLIKANYVSVWDNGTFVRTSCKYDPKEKRCYDIDCSDIDVGDATLEREYVELPNTIRRNGWVFELGEDEGVTFDY